MCYLALEWRFYTINESLRILRMNFWKWVKKFDHQDFQILELGSPGTSWLWQLVQALSTDELGNPYNDWNCYV